MTLEDALAMTARMMVATFGSFGLHRHEVFPGALVRGLEAMAISLGCEPDLAFLLAVDKAAEVLLES